MGRQFVPNRRVWKLLKGKYIRLLCMKIRTKYTPTDANTHPAGSNETVSKAIENISKTKSIRFKLAIKPLLYPPPGGPLPEIDLGINRQRVKSFRLRVWISILRLVGLSKEVRDYSRVLFKTIILSSISLARNRKLKKSPTTALNPNNGRGNRKSITKRNMAAVFSFTLNIYENGWNAYRLKCSVPALCISECVICGLDVNTKTNIEL